MHERYRQTTDRQQTDARRHIANMNMSPRSLKTNDHESACDLVKKYNMNSYFRQKSFSFIMLLKCSEFARTIL